MFYLKRHLAIIFISVSSASRHIPILAKAEMRSDSRLKNACPSSKS